MAMDWSRGSGGGGGLPRGVAGRALDWSRGSSRRSGGSGDLDRSSSRRGGGGGGSGRGGTRFVRRYIRQLSSLVVDPVELDFDQRRLQRAVTEVGEGAPPSCPADAIEVWQYDEDNGRLIRPAGGWWRKVEVECGAVSAAALSRLEDCRRNDYVPPDPVVPGTDLAGILWAESRSGKIGTPSKASEQQESSGRGGGHFSIFQRVRWRDINSIEQDPDSAKGPRLGHMVMAGFTFAAGVPFHFDMHRQGIVIYFAAIGDEDREKLTKSSVTNDAYLYHAAQSIGTTLSLAEIRRASLAERYELKEKCYSVPSLSGMEEAEGTATMPLGQFMTRVKDFKEHSELSHRVALFRAKIPPRAVAWSRKLKGGAMQVPPSMSWRQTLWTAFGSFVGLTVVSGVNEGCRLLTDDEYHLLMGPFGAMCTLVYGLTAAPASQPRNAVLGQAVAGAVSLPFTYIPEHVLPAWIRVALAPALAIATMVKLGLVHPPAGASSVLYASGKYNFGFYGLVVLSTALSIIPATVVNNMSTKRQYPTYWGFQELRELCSRFCQLRGSPGASRPESEVRNQVVDTSLVQSDLSLTRSKRMGKNPLVVHEEEDDGSTLGSSPGASDMRP